MNARRGHAVLGLLGFPLATLLLFVLLFALIDAREHASLQVVRVGSKADTEGLVLGEIVAQLIERRAKLEIERKLQLGGTQICFQALLSGAIDVYPEYTGTALLAILKRPPEPDAPRTWAVSRGELALRYGLDLLAPLAFNNTYALAMSGERARALHVLTISDLKRHPELRAGFTAEFLARPDGYPGLQKTYGLRFLQSPVNMEAGLMYEAVARNQVDVIDAYATDGRIEKLDLRLLRDDLGFFPPYQAAPLVRPLPSLKTREQIWFALRPLAGRITDAEMRRLNAAVDIERRAPSEVARQFVDELLASTAPRLGR